MFPVKKSKAKRKGGDGSEIYRVSVPVRLHRPEAMQQFQPSNTYAYNFQRNPMQQRYMSPPYYGYGNPGIHPMGTSHTLTHSNNNNNNNNRLSLQHRPPQSAGSWFTDAVGYCSSQRDGLRYYDKNVRSALQSIVTFQNKHQNCFGFLPEELQKAHNENIKHVTVMLDAINKAIAQGIKAESDAATRKAREIANKNEIRQLEQAASQELQLAKAKANALVVRQRADALVQDAESKSGRKVDVLTNPMPLLPIPGVDALSQSPVSVAKGGGFFYLPDAWMKMPQNPLKSAGGFFYPHHYGGGGGGSTLRAGGGRSVTRMTGTPYFIVPSMQKQTRRKKTR